MFSMEVAGGPRPRGGVEAMELTEESNDDGLDALPAAMGATLRERVSRHT